MVKVTGWGFNCCCLYMERIFNVLSHRVMGENAGEDKNGRGVNGLAFYYGDRVILAYTSVNARSSNCIEYADY